MNKTQRAFLELNLDPATYYRKTAVPLVTAGLVTAVVGFLLVNMFMSWWLAALIGVAVFAAAVFAVFVLPVSRADQRRMAIENAIPFFMTHLGVLSTSNMPRTEIFRILSLKKEYGPLADEAKRIHSLVVDWNMSLPDACRFVGASTPATILADFLERMAHAMETGQDMEAFMHGEQGVVMKEYATVYETSIYQIENWKDIYNSSMMSGAFFVIFSIILPILTGNDPQRLLLGVFAFMVVMEFALLGLLKMRTPADRLWHRIPIVTEDRTRLRRMLWIGGSLVPVVAVALYLSPLPTGVALAASVVPLWVAGTLARSMEAKVKRREENYSAFIRSLGSSLAAKGGSFREVMRSVKRHNFGPLTDLVDRLYARIAWRLDDNGAWKRFSAESGSSLIDSFTDMFVEGVKSGGKADRVGEIISDNVVRVLNLRKARYSTAGTFRGMLIGLTASMAFVMFIGVGLLGSLGDIFQTTDGIDPAVSPISVDFVVDKALIGDMVLVLIAIHCFIAAAMSKMVDGGSLPAGIPTLILMVWIAVLLATISNALLPRLLSVS